MSIGIIRYPGSNCDYDALRYFDDSFFIWHKETMFPEKLKLLVIPGGFAFGDRLYDNATGSYTISPGTMAVQSPVTKIIMEAVERKIPILGICNGFQILIQLGLLPGKLLLNQNKTFTCKCVKCYVTHDTTNYDTELYIANSYGRYSVDEEEYTRMLENEQIFIRYTDSNSVAELGSMYNIAGVCNAEKNIYGMMPHPERATNINNGFKLLLYKLVFPRNSFINNQFLFHSKILELMHSEHISYKSTKKYLKQLHTKEQWVIQGPGENAGIVDIGDGYCIAIRIESHNHPTFIDPFEGAATGVGGIMRDIFTMGARPIAILDFLRFGTDDNSKELLKKAIDGISYYGNCVGVANVGGDCHIDPTYNKNPLVNVGCLGIMKKENIIYGNATDYGQTLIYVGSKTGNEGIGGAAMASAAFDSKNDVKDMLHNVQKSDPYLEKLLLEACCEIADKKLAIGMQDMGAGGLLCASHEIIRRGIDKTEFELGCNIHLDKVPTKYGMEPCNILISESQERMLIVAANSKIKEIFDIFEKWNLEYSVIGETTFSNEYSVYNNGKMLYTEKMCNYKDVEESWDINNNISLDINSDSSDDCNSNSDTNATIDSTEINNQSYKVKDMDLWKVYDSTVGNRTIKGSDLPGSYSIIDIYETGKQLILTWGGNFNECYLSMNNLKGKPLCIVNCLNFGHPKDSMGDFINTIDDLTFNCKKHNIPVVGGNVSLYNSTDDVSIKPTPILLMMGILFAD